MALTDTRPMVAPDFVLPSGHGEGTVSLADCWRRPGRSETRTIGGTSARDT
jgi:hypothetical protein